MERGSEEHHHQQNNTLLVQVSTLSAMAVAESTIRKMTRLAKECGAVNLSQGFPNEAPPESVRMALAYSVLTGQLPPSGLTRASLMEAFSEEASSSDVTNQYSPPMGRRDVQEAVAAYYSRLYKYDGADPDHTTLTLGATEAVGSALRTIGIPGDKVVIIEPFHELYPNQCKIFYLEPTYVTLREVEGEWKYDADEFRKALSEAKILLLNSPHNPTGKVFTLKELREIVSWCIDFDVYIVTDEIYEHMIYPPNAEHYILPQQFPEAKDRILMCNSIGKSASATGWRLGWCLHPPHLTETYRGIHDQMVVMSPHPVQVATLTYLQLPDEYFTVDLKERYQGRIDTLMMVLREVGFQISQPQGAYYLFGNYRGVAKLKSMDPTEACMYMVETIGVACVPGDNFYGKDLQEGSKYLRFAACRSTSDIDAACTLLIDRLKIS
jgi:aspartate/methionine/tyrosine aminotransferase